MRDAGHLDKDAVRAACPLERIIPELLGEPPIDVGTRSEVKARCPFHEDQRPSLRIAAAKQVWHCDPCQNGGDIFAFAMKLWSCDFAEALRRLAAHVGIVAADDHRSQRRMVVAYDYRSETGKLLYQSVRYEPKDFQQRRPDGRGSWIWNMDGVRRVLYRLPELKGREAVLIVEGEKDVDRGWSIHVPATCNVGGAGKSGKWLDDYSEQLRAAGVRRVAIIPDNDQPGRAHSEAVARSCHAAGLEVRIVYLPDVPTKGDLSDYLATHSKQQLLAVVKTAAPYVPPIDATLTTGSATDIDDAERHAGDEEAAEPLTSGWPAPLGNAAYIGIFGDIVTTLAPETEADPAAVLLQLLALFGNMIGRTAHFCVEADTHYLNLFVALVGPTAKGRKGVAAGQAARFFRGVDEAWMTDRHASGLSSGEGLIYHVRDAVERQQPIKEGGRVVDYGTVIEDAGVSDKRLYVNETEFASVLKVMMREGNTLSPVVRNAWDGKTLRTLTRNSPLQATGPHISIVGSISQQEVRRYLQATECANGFGNRFLWACVKRSQCLPYGGQFVNIEALAARLRELVRTARDAGEVVHDRTASELWEAVYRPLSAGRPGLLGSITARAEAQVQRLACLFALGDGSTVVRAPHMHAALEIWRYCSDSAAYIFGDSLGDPRADKLLGALKHADAAGLTRSEMTRDVFHNNISGNALSQVLLILQEAELVIGPHHQADGLGRPSEQWVYRPRPYERNELTRRNGTSFVSFVGSPTSTTQGSVPVPLGGQDQDDQPPDVFEVT